MKPTLAALVCLALGGAVLAPAEAAAVHKWVDDAGVTHYSDEPPENAETTLIELPEPAAVKTAGNDGSPAADYYSISNQWQRMNAERLERERLNLEREKIRAARQTPAPLPAVADSDDDIRYVPVYSGFGFHRLHRRSHRVHGGRIHGGRIHGGPRPPQRPPAQAGLGTFPTQ